MEYEPTKVFQASAHHMQWVNGSRWPRNVLLRTALEFRIYGGSAFAKDSPERYAINWTDPEFVAGRTRNH